MNWKAYRERKNNERYIQAFYRQGHKVFEVDRQNVTHHGRKWLELSSYDKRKFETTLLLDQMGKERIPVKFLYV